jgi:hypothetical protein
VLATGTGFLAGRLIAAGLVDFLVPNPYRAPARALLVGYLALTLYGLAFGVAQRAVLRPALPALGWIVATTVGAMLAILVFGAVWLVLDAQGPDSPAYRFMRWDGRLALAGAIFGLVVGGCQWVVGRRRGLVAWSWLPLNALGLACAEWLVAVAGGIPPGSAAPPDARNLVVAPLLGGLSYGLITAIGLRRGRRGTGTL